MIFRKIEEIRGGDHRTKLRWLIIFSGIAFVMVIGVWIIAFQVIITTIAENQGTQTESMPSTGFLEKISQTLSQFGGRTSTAIGNLKESIGKKAIELKATSTQQ